MPSALRDCDDLISRLAIAATATGGRGIVFVVGSPLVAPPRRGQPGVPGVESMLAPVQQELDRVPASARQVPAAGSAMERYQEAFRLLSTLAGPDAVNRVVRRAVLCALRQAPAAGELAAIEAGDPDSCTILEDDDDRWVLSPGVESLGTLVADYPRLFGEVLLTSNFDPLVEVSVRRAGGECWTTAPHADLPLGLTRSRGCNVVHLHGYWAGSDTLHHPWQLGNPRPYLEASIAKLLRENIVVVAAYGGWDDVFMRALRQVGSEQQSSPEILWSFLERDERALESDRWPRDLVTRDRIQFFGGVDVQTFFPALLAAVATVNAATAVAAVRREAPSRAARSPRQSSPETLGLPLDDRDLRLAAAPLPALRLAESDLRSLPLDLGTAWGLERGAFTGVLLGRPEDPSYQTLHGVEAALARARREDEGSADLPARRWIRIGLGPGPPPETPAQVWAAARDDSPGSLRLASLREHGLDDGLLAGLFCEVPLIDAGGLPLATLAWSEALERVLAPWAPAMVFHLAGRDAIAGAGAARQLERSLGLAARPFAACRLLARERPTPTPPRAAAAELSAGVASRLGELAGWLASGGPGRHEPEAESRTAAAGIVRRLDESADDLPLGTDREILEQACRAAPEKVEDLLRAYAASARRRARRESLVWAARADDWMDAWLDGAELRDAGAIEELAAVAEPGGGAIVDDLAVALIRRARHSPDHALCEALIARLSRRLSPELCAINRMRVADNPAAVDGFLAASGPRAHGLAVRVGLVPWPSRELLGRADLEQVDLWRLLTALPLNQGRIADLLALAEPGCRAVFGLCTPAEWSNLQRDPGLLRLVLEARRDRTLDFSRTH